mmetsp:Transcript_1415/g.2918  ORF Transcript_1415/g.2918 Transcript_1415/m.2918 type:complete len:133 (-) Transcript_1415:200-598(-)
MPVRKDTLKILDKPVSGRANRLKKIKVTEKPKTLLKSVGRFAELPTLEKQLQWLYAVNNHGSNNGIEFTQHANKDTIDEAYQAAYEDSGSETELKKQQNGDRKLLSKLIMTSANIDEEYGEGAGIRGWFRNL